MPVVGALPFIFSCLVLFFVIIAIVLVVFPPMLYVAEKWERYWRD